MSSLAGFIGLGSMGQGMSLNLLRSGIAVKGYDIDSAKGERLATAGGRACGSPEEAAQDVEILYVCVFSVEEAATLLAPNSATVSALATGATVVMHTTMSPEESRRLATPLLEAGFDYLEAPVTGGQIGADAGTLTAIVSGSRNAMDKAQDGLDAMCDQVYRIGPEAGSALTVKMINQLLVGIHIATTAEALALAVKAGADPNSTFDVISHGRGNSAIFSARAPGILGGHPEGHRTVEIFLKDLGIVLETGRELDMALPLSACAHQLFLNAASIGKQSSGEPSVVSLYEMLNDIDISARAAQTKS